LEKSTLALNPGNIAFVGFNADGNDNIAFVALTDINPGEVIIFEDNEWNGTAFADTNEGAFSWTATSLVAAGTIVRIDNIGSGTIAASTGTAVDAGTLSPSRGTNRGVSASDEVIYAYQGTAASPTFLAAIANGGFNATNGTLTGTGLTAGTNAIDLSTVDDDADVAAYTGNRTGQATFAAYLPLINNPANWTTQDGTGDQSADGTVPDVPFGSTAFTTGSTPPPSGEAPAIAVNISTTDFLDGGSLALLPTTGSGTVSGVINDPTDPARTLGVNFTLTDSDTPVGNLTVTATSSNPSVVPNANLTLTGTGASRNLKINPTGVGFADITVTVSDGSKTDTYTINYAASAASTNPSTTRFLTGTSDASTAIALDSSYMLVADDEDQTIRLYDRNDSGLPLKAFDFTSSLGLSGSSEVDIEASTRTGNTIYWMGSHSNNSSGNDRPNRERIFATQVSGTGATASLSFGGYYSFLEDDLIAWDNANGHGLGAGFLGLANSAAAGVLPEQTNGFNIEGLTFAPNGTTAYVAFRAPNEPTTSRDKALIVPVTNFTSLLSPTGGTAGSATFGAPIQLDLGGRGIRSIERNSSGQYLIIAGPAGSAAGSTPNDFRLYTWTGNPTDTPVLRAADLTALNSGGSFESIVEVPNSLTDSTQIQLLVDNGDTVWYNNGTISKDLSQNNFQKFRSEVIPLGAGGTSSGSDFTLQLFHFSDQEAGIPALDDAPRFSAVLNALKAQDLDNNGTPGFANTLTLSSGDAYIPGLFLDASQAIYGGRGRADILIQNELDVQAIAFGNHEFDLGTTLVRDLIAGSSTSTPPFPGTAFPYLSSNLNFSTDTNLASLVVPDAQAPLPNSIAASTVIEVNGEKIGVVGATTPTITTISSPGGITVLPSSFNGVPTPAQLDALAAEIQTDVNALLAANPDVDKVVLLAHMQQIAIEQELATRLRGVDIIVAGGSNTRLLDSNDRLRAGDTNQGVYPIVKTDADGNPVAVVNTDGNYKYVGRLVIDFDANGNIIPSSYDPNVSGAYATDSQGVTDLNAQSLVDPEIQTITNNLRTDILAKESNVFGISDVYLNGLRTDVRQQQTNLGDLTADANLAIAKVTDPSVVISIKNGGGIRDDIGRIVIPTGSTGEVQRLPNEAVRDAAGNIIKPEGGISETDIANALSFNNGLSLVTVTATQLLALIEHGVAASTATATPGQFPQVSGLAFSYDISRPAGDRVLSLAIENPDGTDIDVVVRNGEIVGDPNRTFRTVTLNFLAGGGDGYPFPTDASANRVDLAQASTAPRTGDATFAPDGSEQDALAEYLFDNFRTTPFNEADTGRDLDERIQNLASRSDTVINGGGTTTTRIYDIQGAGHTSPLVGQTVTTRGIVTAVDTNGFYLQDAQGDGNIATSDAIFVFTSSAPGVTVGTEVQVAGTVSEFTPGGVSTRNLSTTQISGNPTITTLSTGNPLPAATIIGTGGRVPPTANIDDDAFGSFEPTTDGIDFFESLEAMRVTAQDLLVVNGTNEFGEIFGVVDNGAGATGLSDRKTLNISPNDFNPERVQIQADSGVANFTFPQVNTGDRLGNVTGVVGYGFGNFEIVATENFTSNIQSGGLQPEVSTIVKGGNKLTVASYNVLNLDPNETDGDTDVANGRFAAIAQQIVNNLNAPDIIGLQEIQDNSGSANDGVTAANATLQALVDAIAAAGGPTYAFIDNTFIGNNLSGGQPGGNIRTAFLYDPNRVTLVNGSVQTIGSQAPGGAFADGRPPLVATFGFRGQEVTVVNNHFSSKGGSAPILGTAQPFEARQEDTTVNGSLDQRQAQSLAVQGFVNGIQSSNPNARVVVLGDFNEFEFVSPVRDLTTNSGLNNLTETLPENERYSFIFQGNSQSLDHILVSNSLKNGATFDAVHVNSEFVENNQRASDHDPLLASLTIGNPGQTIVGTDSFDFLRGGNADDTISGLQGNDIIFGGAGNDSISGDRGLDFLYGEDGDDTLLGGNGTDFLFGGLGNDSILGGGNIDFLNGDAGNDTMLGGDDADTMLGSAGDDKLFGENGNDALFGGRGDDVLVGGTGNDYLEGGNGLNDTAEFEGLRSAFTLSGSRNNFVVRNSALGIDTLVGVEFLKFSDGIFAVSDVLV
jgi:predicted extracellular nuclease/2',3'-cyclic-nucleotide 2'-phosphodiesterase (5'-nucleotidase family)